MAAKFGFEAIQYVLKKALTKKGVRGIPTIPGKAYDMRMKQLVDEMANRMRKIGYDINQVTEKQVQGLLDYAEAMEKQRLKNIQSRFFDRSGKMKPEGEDIVKKGLEGLGKKKDVPDWTKGWTPRIVPEEVTASPDRIRRGFSTVMKLNSPDENQALIKSFMRRENAEFNSLNREQQKEIFDMFDTWAKRDIKPDPADFASGGIAGGRIGFSSGGNGVDDKTLTMSKIRWANALEDGTIAPGTSFREFLKLTYPNYASGGIAGQLHLNQGGRAKFQDGALAAYNNPYGRDYIAKKYDLAYKSGQDPKYAEKILADIGTGPSSYYGGPSGVQDRIYQQNLINLKLIEGSDIEDPYTDAELKDYLDKLYLQGESFKDYDWSQGRLGRGRPFYRESPETVQTHNMLDPLQLSNLQSAKWMRENLNRLEETRGKDLIRPYRDILDKLVVDYPMTWRTGEPEYLQKIFGKGFTPEAAPTGIETVPTKRSFNVMMDEKGNVMDDQSMAELARETGVAPDIQNYPIRSMSDVQRMIGPGESVAEGTAYNPLVDPRMARSYQENIQLMGDPRMRPPMPMGGTPIDVMPPLSNEFTTDPDAGLSGQEIAEKYGIPYAKGGLAKVLGV